MEFLRRKLVYQLFIDQFTAMSEVTIKYQAFDHGLHLLKQAMRLVDLLADDNHIEESQNLLEKIESMRENILKLKGENVQGPELPRRMSIFDNGRYRKNQTEEIDTSNDQEEIPSEDDNDEIYSYHRSVVAQIHATSVENLARFQHNDDCDDDEIESISKSVENINLDNETKL
jgi:hypothetical protein